MRASLRAAAKIEDLSHVGSPLASPERIVDVLRVAPCAGIAELARPGLTSGRCGELVAAGRAKSKRPPTAELHGVPTVNAHTKTRAIAGRHRP